MNMSMSRSRSMCAASNTVHSPTRIRSVDFASNLAASTTIGKRPAQEDRFTLMPCFAGQYLFAAVFDGHGNAACSQHCADHMASCVRRHIDADADDNLDIEAALRAGFTDCDASIPAADCAEAGSTAVCMVVGPAHVHVAHVGDSRAVIARADGGAVALTSDHTPDREDEKLRVLAAGGHVLFCDGCPRLMGCLNMSRAIGDASLRPYGLTADPDVATHVRTPADEFAILASDGLWNVISNEAACNIVRACIRRSQDRGINRPHALRVAAHVLVRAALDNGSVDNVTVVVVDLV